MKKEYLILIGLIIALGAYLFFHKEDRDNYTLPDIPQIDTENVTGIIIKEGDTVIHFDKTDNTWTLTEKAYPADHYMIDNMLATFKNFKLAALVSQNGDLVRYELDKDKRIQVTLIAGEKTVFDLSVGKTAPSFNHTFVMLKDDGRVYHATGSFRSNFDNDVADFRDKKVFSFETPAIKKMIIEHGDISKTLSMKQEKDESESSPAKWTFENGKAADGKTVSKLISDLNRLECETYLEETPDEFKKSNTPDFKIQLESDTKLELTLFKKADEDIKGISSMNKYLFALSQYNGNEITSTIEKLLGIYKAEDKKD